MLIPEWAYWMLLWVFSGMAASFWGDAIERDGPTVGALVLGVVFGPFVWVFLFALLAHEAIKAKEKQ